MKVYLAGGLRSGWQDRVIENTPGTITIFDPRAHGFRNQDRYTTWDLSAIRECNVVLAYMEKSNPGGQNLALEIGYAAALGKVIIYIEDEYHQYMGMARVLSDVYAQSISAGIDMLIQLHRVIE